MLQQRFPALNIHRIVTSQAIFRRYSASEVIRYHTIIPSHNTHCSKLIISSNRCTIQLFKYINSHTEIGINSKTTGFERHYDPIHVVPTRNFARILKKRNHTKIHTISRQNENSFDPTSVRVSNQKTTILTDEKHES